MVDSKSKVLAKHIASKSIKLHNAERNLEQPKKGLELIFYFLLAVSSLYFIYDLFLLSRFYDKIVEKLISINKLWAFITLCGMFISLCLIVFIASFTSFTSFAGENKEGEGNKEGNVHPIGDWLATPFFIVVIGFTPVICDLDVFGDGIFNAIISCFAYFFTFAFVMLATSVLAWLPFGICLASRYIVGAAFYIWRKFSIYVIGESLTQDVNELNHNISPVMLPILNSMGGGTLGEIYNEVNRALEFISVDVLKVLLSNHESIEVVKFDEYICYKSKLVSGGSNMKTVILDDE